MDYRLTEEDQKEIEKHYGLVWFIVNNHYRGLSKLTRTDREDFFQEGVIGLITAYKKYDKSYNVTFATHAIIWIRQAISRAIVDKFLNIVRWPAFCAYELLTDNIGYRKGNPIRYLSHGERFVISGGGMSEMDQSVINYLHCVQDNGLPQHRIDELRVMFNIAINRLDDRSKDIMIKRFGLDGNEPMILQEIGNKYNLTRERIRQIEVDAIEKLALYLGKDPVQIQIAIENIGDNKLAELAKDDIKIATNDKISDDTLYNKIKRNDTIKGHRKYRKKREKKRKKEVPNSTEISGQA